MGGIITALRKLKIVRLRSLQLTKDRKTAGVIGVIGDPNTVYKGIRTFC